jgi:hypothetical protein
LLGSRADHDRLDYRLSHLGACIPLDNKVS